MIRSRGVLRAWLIAHEARTAAAAATLVTLGLVLGAGWLLPVPGQARRVPLWQFTPGALAMLASLTTVNRLSSLGSVVRLRVARAAWAVAVVAVSACCARVIDLAAGLPTLVPGTVVVVALTFTTATVLGRMSVWVGAVLALVVLMRVTTMAADEDLWASLAGPVQLGLAALATAGLAAYSWIGGGVLTRDP